MTTVNSTTYAAQTAGKIALDPGIANSSLHVISTEYEASALPANDVINLFKLPKGAIIHGMTAAFDDLGTGTSLDIGDAGDVDRYFDGIDTATAAGSVSNVLVAGLGYKIGTDTTNDDTIIQAKNLGAAATGTLKVVCYYAM